MRTASLPRAAGLRARLALAVAALPAIGYAQYVVEEVATGLEHPWSIAFPEDGRYLVTERPGRLRSVTAQGVVSEPLSGIPPVHVGGQAGLKEVSLAPDFVTSGVLYLSYACGTATANTTCLARGRLIGDGVEQLEEVFRAQPLRRGNAHYGGRIAWLPDNSLLLTLGDAFDLREQAQNPANHLGKVVRLLPDGSVPSDNPFVGRPDHAPEIFTLGHRNVQGVVWDHLRGRIVAHEHGPRGGDEINILQAGANYGWPAVTSGIDYSGAIISPYRELPGYRAALLTFTPSIAPADITLYDGDQFPAWRGDFLIAALARARGVHRVRMEGDRAEVVEVLLTELDERVRSVRTGPDGAVYVLTDSASGRLLRLSAGPAVTP